MDSKIDLSLGEISPVNTPVKIDPIDATPVEEVALQDLPTLSALPGVTTFSVENPVASSPYLLALRSFASYACFFVAGYK